MHYETFEDPFDPAGKGKMWQNEHFIAKMQNIGFILQ